MRDQGNTGIRVIENMLNQGFVVGIDSTLMTFAYDDMWADIDADNLIFQIKFT